MSYFFEEPFETLRELDDLYEKHVHNQTERRFVLEAAEDSKAVGVLSLIEIDEINRKCEIDIIIDDRHQGKGYGRAGFVLGVKYGFDILNLYKIYLQILPDNLAGMRIYQYTGFKKECRLKKEYFVNGRYVDAHRMCMFKQQWIRERQRLRLDIGFDREDHNHAGRSPKPISEPLQAPSQGPSQLPAQSLGQSLGQSPAQGPARQPLHEISVA